MANRSRERGAASAVSLGGIGAGYLVQTKAANPYQESVDLFLDELGGCTPALMEAMVSGEFLMYCQREVTPQDMAEGFFQPPITIIYAKRETIALTPTASHQQRRWDVHFYSAYADMLPNFLKLVVSRSTALDTSGTVAAVADAADLQGSVIQNLEESFIRRLFIPYNMSVLFMEDSVPILITSPMQGKTGLHFSDFMVQLDEQQNYTAEGKPLRKAGSAASTEEAKAAECRQAFKFSDEGASPDEPRFPCIDILDMIHMSAYETEPMINRRVLELNIADKETLLKDFNPYGEYTQKVVISKQDRNTDTAVDLEFSVMRVREVDVRSGYFYLLPVNGRVMLPGFKMDKFYHAHVFSTWKSASSKVDDTFVKYTILVEKNGAADKAVNFPVENVEFLYKPITNQVSAAERKKIHKVLHDLHSKGIGDSLMNVAAQTTDSTSVQILQSLTSYNKTSLQSQASGSVSGPATDENMWDFMKRTLHVLTQLLSSTSEEPPSTTTKVDYVLKNGLSSQILSGAPDMLNLQIPNAYSVEVSTPAEVSKSGKRRRRIRVLRPNFSVVSVE